MKEAVNSPDVAARISQALAFSIKLLISENDRGWVKKFSGEDRRGILTAIEAGAYKTPQPESLHEALEFVLLNDSFTERGHVLHEEALNIYKGFGLGKKVDNPVTAVSKTIVHLTLKASSSLEKLSHGALSC